MNNIDILELYTTRRNQTQGQVAVYKSKLYEEALVYDGVLPVYDKGNLNVDRNSQIYNNSKKAGAVYLSPDYKTASDNYADNIINNFPSIEFQNNGEQLSDEQTTELNTVFRNVAMGSNLNYKMTNVIRRGIRAGICVCELVPSTINTKGKTRVVDDKGVEKFVEAETGEQRGFVDIISYNPFDVLIDPNADPDDVRGTAEFIIVDLGYYSLSQFNDMKKENNWKVPENEEVLEINSRNNYAEAIKNLEGVVSRKGVKISKMYDNKGKVTVVVNDGIVVKHSLNAKMMYKMPLIVYSSIAGGSTPYGDSLFSNMRQSVLAKSMLSNMVFDNVGKNLNAKVITRDAKLSGTNLNDYPKGAFVRAGQTVGSDKPLGNEFFTMQYPDMTQGSLTMLNLISGDVQQTSRMSSLELQGGQGEAQVRTNAIMQQMSQGSLKKTSAFVKQAEYTLMQEIAKDMLWIFFAFYDDYPEISKIDRAVFANMKALRIRQGSTLDEDKMTRFQRFMLFLEIIRGFGAETSFDTEKILDMAMDIAGFNVAEYKLSEQESLFKLLLSMGLPTDVAKAQVTAIMGAAQGQAEGQPQGQQNVQQ